MKDYFQKRVKKRSIIFSFFLLLWILAIIFRLIQFQVLEHSRIESKVLHQNQSTDSILPKRGTIYDRTGIILARSVPRPSIYYTPFDDKKSGIHRQKIRQLDRILNLQPHERKRIENAVDKEKSFVFIRRKCDPQQANAVKKLDLKGIHFEVENQRLYPQGKRACHVLGRVNIDEKGQSGVEYTYNQLLKGEEGKRLNFFDAKRREYRFEIISKPVNGKDLTLTIEETIQYIVEKELARAVREKKADWGTVIVSIPQTGEILAMANYPAYDPNYRPPNMKSVEKNKAVQRIFDPGSTFKIITAAAALESGLVRFDDSFDCSEHAITVSRKLFRDHKPFGVLRFPEVIINSSNVGTIQIGQRTGEEILYNTARRFGIGQKTGIDLPGEEGGIFHSLEKWTDISVSSISIGYEVSVTPMQILQVINTIANQGVHIPPRIVKEHNYYTRNTKEEGPVQRQVISPESARMMASTLVRAVEHGTGMQARIEGYSVAGKTGTSQKYDAKIRQYSSESHTASFAGYVAAPRPEFSMVVVIDNPQGDYYGGEVAAPVFQRIAQQILRYLQIPGEMTGTKTLIAANTWEGNGT